MSGVLTSCRWVARQVARGWRTLLTTLRDRAWASRSRRTTVSGSLADGVAFTLHSETDALPHALRLTPIAPWLSAEATSRFAAECQDLLRDARLHFQTGEALRPLAGIARLGVVVTTLVDEARDAEPLGVHLLAVTPSPCMLGEPPHGPTSRAESH